MGREREEERDGGGERERRRGRERGRGVREKDAYVGKYLHFKLTKCGPTSDLK